MGRSRNIMAILGMLLIQAGTNNVWAQSIQELLSPANLAFKVSSNSLASKGPPIQPLWKASVVSGNTMGESKGTFYYDSKNQRFRLQSCGPSHIFHPDDQLCTDELAKKNGVPAGYNTNFTIGPNSDDALCKVIPSPYNDFFGGLYAAKPQGPGMVGSVSCEVWKSQINWQGTDINFTACIDSNRIPRQYNTTMSKGYVAFRNTIITFSNITIGSLTDNDFAPSDACAKRFPMPPCNNSAMESFDVYRVRSSKEPNSLDNRNVGDALGDMAFFCDISGMDESQVVTRWSVLANSSWGQYGYCLYQGGVNRCYGMTGKHVGRQSALGLGKGSVQGQCSPNDDVGSWFAFPAEGSCPPNASIGTGGCTWTAKPQRTVSAACILNERGLKKSCAKEYGHAPMTKSASIFRLALESSDPAKGGCPDVTAASYSDYIVV